MNNAAKPKEQHIGVWIALASLLVSIILCSLAYVFRECCFLKLFLKYAPEKETVLGIVTAINICVATTLTLSLTIEGDKDSFYFGISPKTLNTYVGNRISLSSSYIALVGSFIVSLCLLKGGLGLLFYAFSISSLLYFLVAILSGLPVLKGKSKTVFSRMGKDLENINLSRLEKEPTGAALDALFRKGISVEEIYSNIRGKNKNFSEKELKDLKDVLLRYLYRYLLNGQPNEQSLSKLWGAFKEHLLLLASREDASFYCEVSIDFFECLLLMYKKDFLRKEIFRELYRLSFSEHDKIKVEQNRELVDDLFVWFISYSLQNNDLTFFALLKEKISLDDLGNVSSKGGRSYFMLISFLFFCYCRDGKVSAAFKNEIAAFVGKKEDKVRYQDYSWNTIFNTIIFKQFDFDRNKLFSEIEQYDGLFEYTIYGRGYTPIVTIEHFCDWYWFFLLVSGKAKNLDSFINKSNKEEVAYFERFYSRVKNGKTDLYKKIFSFYRCEDYSPFYLNFEDDIAKEIEEFYLNDKTQKLNDEIVSGEKDSEEIVKKCDETVSKEIKKYCIGERRKNVSRHTFSFFAIYDKQFDPDKNMIAISYNASNYVARHFLASLKIVNCPSEDAFVKTVEAFTKRKQKIWINSKFRNYCVHGRFSERLMTIVQRSTIIDNDLFYYPACFTTKLPYIGNIVTKTSIEGFSDEELLKEMRIRDSGNGYYVFKDIKLNEADFRDFFKRTYVKLRITVSYDIDPSPKGGLILNPQE